MDEQELERRRREAKGDATDTPPTELTYKASLAKVHSKLSDNVKDDFVLARIDEDRADKMVNCVSNAYDVISFFQTLQEKTWKYEWIPDSAKEKGHWIKRRMNENEKNKMNVVGKRIFDGLMTKMTMTAVLNRNVKENYLINGLLDRKESEDGATILQKIMGGGKQEEAHKK